MNRVCVCFQSPLYIYSAVHPELPPAPSASGFRRSTSSAIYISTQQLFLLRFSFCRPYIRWRWPIGGGAVQWAKKTAHCSRLALSLQLERRSNSPRSRQLWLHPLSDQYLVGRITLKDNSVRGGSASTGQRFSSSLFFICMRKINI